MNAMSKRLKYFFITLFFVFGLDYGFIQRKLRFKTLLINAYIILHCIFKVYFYSSLERGTFYMLLWLLTFLSQQVLLSIVLGLTASSKRSFYNLQQSLTSIDLKMNVEILTEKQIIFTCFFLVAFRLTSSYVYCLHYPYECDGVNTLISWLGPLQMLPLDIGNMLCFFVFYSVHLRMQVFIKVVKNNDYIVMECIHIYKSIVDAVDLIKKPLQVLYAGALAINAPNIIAISYFCLTKPKTNSGGEENFMVDYVVRTFYFIEDFFLVCAPAFAAGLVASEVDELRQILGDKILQERRKDYSAYMELFTDYVNARPLRLTLFNIFPLDFSLPLIFINFCITYQIVVVQLKNLF